MKLPLGSAVEAGIVEEVVGQRVQHAVGEEAWAEGDGPVEKQLKRVADPHVAEGLPQAIQAEAGVERAGLPREGDRGFEEVIPAEEAAVAVRPSQPRGTERLKALADGLAPNATLAFALGDSLDLGGERVDQPGGRVLVAEMEPEAGGGAQNGKLGRRRHPQPFVRVAQGVDAIGEARFLGCDEESRGDDACFHAGGYAGGRGAVPSERLFRARRRSSPGSSRSSAGRAWPRDIPERSPWHR